MNNLIKMNFLKIKCHYAMKYFYHFLNFSVKVEKSEGKV